MAHVASAPPMTSREVLPANDREGGHKYFAAVMPMKDVLSRYESEHGGRCLLREVGERLKASKNPQERIFLQNLINAMQAIKCSNGPIRERNTAMIQGLRDALKSDFYQQNKGSGNEYCKLVQDLCVAKFTKVYPFESFKQLVQTAALSGDSRALDGLPGIDKDTVGPVTRHVNHCLSHAASDYTKSWAALSLQKLRGEYGGKWGLPSDPLGTSNVPYLRSRFSYATAQGERGVDFCRFGTPTIQKSGKTEIDPMFLGALDAMRADGKNFLYVNHQKLDGKEGVRASAIKAIQESHQNFHFLSIPLDGAIVDSIRGSCSIQELKKLIGISFSQGTNGCALPRAANISNVELNALLEHVHTCWFPGVTQFTPETLEAFWGIFNTTLKHYTIKKLGISVMNSSCKDNKDRGGTLGTIDEAVRNVLLGTHNDPDTLRELVYNALAPYMIKLEHILDDPSKPNHHRLGYLISVLNHIATLTPAQIATIQTSHANLCFPVTGQAVP
jgi:hypothetical protein